MEVDMQKLIKDWFAAWNARDPEKLVQFYADDGIFNEVPTGKISRGQKALTETFTTIFADYPDLECEPKAAFYSPDAVCGEFVMSGTHARVPNPSDPSAGKRISVRVGFIVELEKDKIKRHTDYFDALTIARQLGRI